MEKQSAAGLTELFKRDTRVPISVNITGGFEE